jgi:hypothetical protein
MPSRLKLLIYQLIGIIMVIELPFVVAIVLLIMQRLLAAIIKMPLVEGSSSSSLQLPVEDLSF